MKTKSTRKQVEHDIAMQIRSEMQYIPDPEIYQLDNFDFKSVKQVSHHLFQNYYQIATLKKHLKKQLVLQKIMEKITKYGLSVLK